MSDAEKTKTPMSDEERRALAEKLDRDLDEFISSRKETRYTEGWNEATWEQEMVQHPFFMTQAPEEGEPLPPLLEGLQQLKYDPDENTPDELATSYKEDGNFNFKVKKYRWAILNYTEGIKIKPTDVSLLASLHLNRAAAHFHLENYRSSLNDSLAAAKLKPDYLKAVVRAVRCCQKLKRPEEGLKWCDYGLRLSSSEPQLTGLRTELVKQQKEEARNRRKAEVAEKKAGCVERLLLDALRDRKVNLFQTGSDGSNDLNLAAVEPCHPAAVGKRVHLDESGALVWPVLFLYPEYGETDFIQEFHEDSTLAEHVEVMFEEAPGWDVENKYRPDRLSIYYEDVVRAELHVVRRDSTLKEILRQPTYHVRAGTPGFILLVEGSKKQREFLKNYTVVP